MWVEINGVSGEVIELGIFHTVLLETGSWGDSGHPTGRRVTFTNSFAIGGHYFEILLTDLPTTQVDQYVSTTYLGGAIRRGDIHLGFNIERRFGKPK